MQYNWSQLTGMGWRQWHSEHKGELLEEEDFRPEVSHFFLKINHLFCKTAAQLSILYSI